ncbi:MAG: sensor histidine kinase [Methylophagaceae bacterium]
MKISSAIIIHTLLCSITAIGIVVGHSKFSQIIQEEQHKFDTGLVVLRDFRGLQQSSRQWLSLSDLIIASGETYLIGGTLKQGKVLLELLEDIETYLEITKPQSVITSIKDVIISNNNRIKQARNLNFEEDQNAFNALLNELDVDAVLFISALVELENELDASIAQRSVKLLAQQSQLQMTTWAVAIIYILLVFISWRWQTKLLVKPIQNLTLAARKALVDDVPINLKEDGSQEVRELTRYTHKFVTTLETKVQDRTIELQQRQNELELENINRKKAEIEAITSQQQAEKANKAKSEFLSSMSHELRTPLNAILGFTQLLELDDGDAPLNAEQKESLSYILSSGKHLLNLVNEVLELSAIEAGKLDLSLEELLITDVYRDACVLLQPLANTVGIDIYSKSQTPIAIKADYIKLKQVLLNLVSNAIKYNSEGGEVAIDWITTAENMIRVNITDNGYGISEANQKQLFTAFNRLGHEASTIEGVGIGLIVTRELIILMGGKIGFESQENIGSIFWFELPLA